MFGERILGCVVLATLVAMVVGCAQPPSETAAPPSPEVISELDQLFADVWQSSLERSALLRVREGVPILVFDDLSHRGFLADVEIARGWLERLDSIDLEAVDRKQTLSAEALRWRLATTVEGER